MSDMEGATRGRHAHVEVVSTDKPRSNRDGKQCDAEWLFTLKATVNIYPSNATALTE
jgi:hypothetical protein